METHNECVKRLMKEINRAECDDECRVNLYRIMYQTCQKNNFKLHYNSKIYHEIKHYFLEYNKKNMNKKT
jgi:hypothetical protein